MYATYLTYTIKSREIGDMDREKNQEDCLTESVSVSAPNLEKPYGVSIQIDVRSIADNGEIACRNSSLSGQNIVASFTSTMNNEDVAELTVITADGKGAEVNIELSVKRRSFVIKGHIFL